MKLSAFLIAFAICASPVNSGRLPQAWMTQIHRVLMDGNELYALCLTADKTITVTGEDKFTVSRRDSDELYATGKCVGYITALADSIPDGEGFDPDQGVRLTQYMDVVRVYLRDNPNRRHEPAYILARIALTKAFPSRQ